MSYRCSGCKKVVGPNKPMRRHTIYRERSEQVGERVWTRKEIAKELPVCDDCAPKMAAALDMLMSHK